MDIITGVAATTAIYKLLPNLYQDLAQPSVKKLGTALETVVEYITLPHLYLKLESEKFKENLKRNLDNYKKKLDGIPEEDICDVNPQIGIPIFEKLTYTTNEEIADLFTSILAKASNIKTINEAHPAFIQIIERLSVDEARVIKSLIGKEVVPYINLKVVQPIVGYTFFNGYLSGIEGDIELIAPHHTTLYFQNLSAVGLLEDDKQQLINRTRNYNEIKDFYKVKELQDEFLASGKNLEVEERRFNITKFGLSFISACTSKI